MYITNQIKRLVGEDETKMAVNNLISIIDSYQKIHSKQSPNILSINSDLILTQSRLNRVSRQIRNDLLSTHESNLELNKINNSILTTISEIESCSEIKPFIEKISINVELEQDFGKDSNSNKISDVLEDCLSKMGFNHFEVIDKIVDGTSYIQDYVDIKYPFLRQLDFKIKQNFEDELIKISKLANDIYNYSESLVENEQLREWINASPESWLVYEEQASIKGFIHVEILSREKSEQIINGFTNEGQIKGDDILQVKNARESDYVHIGSIISHMDVNKVKRYPISTHLVYGLAERILEIRLKTGITKIFSVSYPDKFGNYNANLILKKFGFQHNGKQTNEGDKIFELDLNAVNNRYILDLFEKVEEHRKKAAI